VGSLVTHWWDSSTSGTPQMVVLKHNRRQTGLLVVCLFSSGGDWRSTQNDGLWQAGSQVNNPCPLVFVPTIEWEAETNITNSGCFFKLGCGRSSVRQRFNTGDRGLLELLGGATLTSPLPGPPEKTSDNRANGVAVRCLKD
jgi:hypothetical protein